MIANTPVTKFLKKQSVEFQAYEYNYQDKGGARQEAEMLRVKLHKMLKTLVFKATDLAPFIVIMFEDMDIPKKKLANYLDVKKVYPCDTKTSTNRTRPQHGGVSTFDTQRLMKVLVPKEISNIDEICIDGGRRVLILQMKPNSILESLDCNVIQFIKK